MRESLFCNGGSQFGLLDRLFFCSFRAEVDHCFSVSEERPFYRLQVSGKMCRSYTMTMVQLENLAFR